jgi:hypothetical protein
MRRLWIGVLDHPKKDLSGIVVLDLETDNTKNSIIELYNFRTNKILLLGRQEIERMLRPLAAEEYGLEDAAARSYLSFDRNRTNRTLKMYPPEDYRSESVGEPIECRECGGRGWITDWPESTRMFTCPICNGLGTM